ncbi:DNA repair RAD51-like protein 4 isoform B [Alligator mississippiensis]|uniref:DNA repair RAD51-like protein 4 isoform B n=1 Tax=Alligator mississippiensis TaxID=8496 RepID=A0A151N6S0_ALLMI|nr:DNA repair RAD51-like protein 4 isoform B [Alligator mississippiensis]
MATTMLLLPPGGWLHSSRHSTAAAVGGFGGRGCHHHHGPPALRSEGACLHGVQPPVSCALPPWARGRAMVMLQAGLCPGLTAEMIQLLKASGIRTVVDLISSDLEEVAQKCSLSYKALVAVRRVLLAQFSAFPINGVHLYEELKSSMAILSTGNKSLDTLLDSGLYTGEVMELMGAPGSGKTQVCLSIAASVSHSLKQNVLFIDSTGGFTASRLLQLVQFRTEEEEEQVEALQRIQVAHVFDIYKMLAALQELRHCMSQQVVCSGGPVKLLVVDSVSAVVCPLFGGRQSEGLALMMQLARELKTLAREFGLATVPTGIKVELDIGGYGALEERPVFMSAVVFSSKTNPIELVYYVGVLL